MRLWQSSLLAGSPRMPKAFVFILAPISFPPVRHCFFVLSPVVISFFLHDCDPCKSILSCIATYNDLGKPIRKDLCSWMIKLISVILHWKVTRKESSSTWMLDWLVNAKWYIYFDIQLGSFVLFWFFNKIKQILIILFSNCTPVFTQIHWKPECGCFSLFSLQLLNLEISKVSFKVEYKNKMWKGKKSQRALHLENSRKLKTAERGGISLPQGREHWLVI